MAHHQHSVLTLKRKEIALAPLLEPYLKKDYLEGRYISEGLNFSKILPCPKNLRGQDREKWCRENWGSRSFVIDGVFVGNEYFFTSIDCIPFRIYQRLSTLIGEQFSVEVHSLDDLDVGKWEFRPDGMMRALFFAEGYFDNTAKPRIIGKLPKPMRKNVINPVRGYVDSNGSPFEDLPFSSNSITGAKPM